MKKTVVLLLCLMISLFSAGCNRSSTKGHIKSDPEDPIKTNAICLPAGLEFGMKEGEVTEILGGEFTTYSDTLIYDWRYFEEGEDYPAPYDDYYLLTVGFTKQNKFEYLCYTLDPNNDETPYDDYYAVLEYLKGYYGDPTTHKDTWTDKRYKDDAPMWNKAVQQEHLSMYDEWKMDGYYFRLASASSSVSITFVKDQKNFG